MAKNTICLWYDKDAEAAARFYAETFPDSTVGAIHRAPSDYPSGKKGDVLIVEFKVAGIFCIGLNGGPTFKHNEAFSFQIATDDQSETDRYWNAIVGNGGQESACGWCKDKWGVSWQITPRVLTEAVAAGGDEAKRVFDAMMGMKKIDIAPGAFAIYIGTHGDRGASRANVVLPGAAYPEKSAVYVNTEGRVQMATRASFPPGDAREDWAILRALSDVLKHRLPYDSLRALRQTLFAAHPHLMRLGQITPADPADIRKLAALDGNADNAFKSSVDDFYLTSPITRASPVMAECSALAQGRAAATAAE